MSRLATVALVVPAFPAVATAGETISGPAEVINGNTLRVGGVKVRLHGIDAPELNQTCWDDRGEFPCSNRAKWKLGIIINGTRLQILNSIS